MRYSFYIFLFMGCYSKSIGFDSSGPTDADMLSHHVEYSFVEISEKLKSTINAMIQRGEIHCEKLPFQKTSEIKSFLSWFENILDCRDGICEKCKKNLFSNKSKCSLNCKEYLRSAIDFHNKKNSEILFYYENLKLLFSYIEIMLKKEIVVFFNNMCYCVNSKNNKRKNRCVSLFVDHSQLLMKIIFDFLNLNNVFVKIISCYISQLVLQHDENFQQFFTEFYNILMEINKNIKALKFPADIENVSIYQNNDINICYNEDFQNCNKKKIEINNSINLIYAKEIGQLEKTLLKNMFDNEVFKKISDNIFSNFQKNLKNLELLQQSVKFFSDLYDKIYFVLNSSEQSEVVAVDFVETNDVQQKKLRSSVFPLKIPKKQDIQHSNYHFPIFVYGQIDDFSLKAIELTKQKKIISSKSTIMFLPKVESSLNILSFTDFEYIISIILEFLNEESFDENIRVFELPNGKKRINYYCGGVLQNESFTVNIENNGEYFVYESKFNTISAIVNSNNEFETIYPIKLIDLDELD